MGSSGVRVCLFILAGMASLSAHAFFYQASVYGVEIPATVPNFAPDDVPGELIDQRTGSLSWQEKEFELHAPSGWAFPVIRSYGTGFNGAKHMGNWQLETPRIMISTNPTAKVGADASAASICEDPSPTSFRGYKHGDLDWGTEPATEYGDPIQLVIPGEPGRTLVRKVVGLPGFPTEAVWVTSDNWYAECLSGTEGFKVYSPDGRVFVMDLLGRNPDYWLNGGGGRGHISFQATSMSNQFGESFRFKYNTVAIDLASSLTVFPSGWRGWAAGNLSAPVKHYLDEISFGGVDDDEQDFTPLLKAYYSSSQQLGAYPLVEQLRYREPVSYDAGTYVSPDFGLYTTAYSELQTVTYSYGTYPFPSHYCSFIPDPVWEDDCQNRENFVGRLLISAAYPDGKSTYYEYHGPIQGSVADGVTTGGSYTGLSRVLHKSGADINYTYQKLAPNVVGAEHVSASVGVPAIKDRTVVDTLGYQPGYLIVPPVYTSHYTFQLVNGKTVSTVTRDDVIEKRIYSLDRNAKFAMLESEEVTSGTSGHTTVYGYNQVIQVGQPSSRTHNDDYALYNYLQTDIADGAFSSVRTYDSVYGLVLTETQGGLDGSTTISRQVVTEYQHPYVDYGKAFIVGLPKRVTVDGLEQAYRLFNWQGLMLEERAGGAERSYTYYAAPEYYDDQLGSTNWSVSRGIVQDVLGDTSGFLAAINWQNQSSQELRFLGKKAGQYQAVKWGSGMETVRSMTVEGRFLSWLTPEGYEVSYQYDEAGRPTLVQYFDIFSQPPSGSPYFPYSTQYIWPSGDNTLYIYQGALATKKVFSAYGNLIFQKEYNRSYPTLDAVVKHWTYDRYNNVVFESLPYLEGDPPAVIQGKEFEYDYQKRMVLARDSVDSYTKFYCYNDGLSQCAAGHGLNANEFSRVEWDTESARIHQTLTGYQRGQINYPSLVTVDIEEDGSGGTVQKQVQYEYTSLLQPETVSIGSYVTSYTYDPVYSRLEGVSPGVSSSYSLTYYPGGELSTKTFSDGRVQTSLYTDFGALDEVLIDGQTVYDYSYNTEGQLELLRNIPDGVDISWDYEQFGLVKSEHLTVNTETFSYAYMYDGYGRVSEITYPSDATYLVPRDYLGRLTAITSNGEQVAYANGFSPAGQPTEILLKNGMRIDMAYDDKLRIDQKTASDADGNMVFGQDLQFLGNNNIERVDDMVNGFDSLYAAYDLAGRLITASYPGSYIEYKYDDYENIQSVSVNGLVAEQYYYNNAKLTGKSSQGVYEPIGHDAAGNVSSYGVRVYGFDSAGMLESHQPASGPALEYRYSGQKRKALVIEGGVPAVVHAYSSVMGKTLYSKNLKTGIATDNLFYESNLVAMFDEVPETDSDGDMIPDALELELGLNPADSGDALVDLDGDGLNNRDELELGLLATSPDSDGDGMSDGDEVTYGLNPFANDYYLDLDGDGIANGEELVRGWSPASTDSDGDGILDGDEWYVGVDTDDDGLSDEYEVANGMDPYDPSDGLADADSDGYALSREVFYGTSDLNPLQIPSAQHTVQVQASEDDAEEGFNQGNVRLDEGRFQLGDERSGHGIGGFRFPLDADAGDVVAAHLEFFTKTDKEDPALFQIAVEDTGNAAVYEELFQNISSRSYGVSQDWDPGAWVHDGKYSTVDVSSLINATLSRGDWQAGNIKLESQADC